MKILRQELYFPLIIGIHFVMWGVDLAMFEGAFIETDSDTFFGAYTNTTGIHPLRIAGEVFSSWVVTVFGFNFLMATRARWVERIFGGLDKMYLIHRRSGVIAVVLLVAHFIVVPRDLSAFTPGKPIGFWAFVLIILGVIASAAPPLKKKLPYHIWVRMHRLMGVFYIMGIVHATLVFSLIRELPMTRVYVFGMAMLGILSWVYRTFFYRFNHPELEYEVSNVRDLGHGMVELNLVAKDKALDYEAGQFAFFRFPSLSKEQHPFTISNAPGQEGIRVTIKNLGDYTGDLVENLKAGSAALVEGAFGHFQQSSVTGKAQVWVGGGIGITPFLAMANNIKTPTHLYWTVADAGEAVYADELRAVAERQENFSFTLWDSKTDGFITAEALKSSAAPADTTYLLCGPAALKSALTKQLRSEGVRQVSILDEEFAFR